MSQYDFVRPAAPLQAGHSKHAIPDLMVSRIYVPWLLCFPPEHVEDEEKAYEQLKEGLSQLLVQVPFLAAKENNRVPGGGFWSLETPERPHVIFNRRRHANLSYHNLASRGFLMSQIDTKLLAPHPMPHFGHDEPTFVAQANFLGDGGLLLMVAFSHMVGDAVSMGAILRQWASNTSLVALGDAQAIRSSLPAELLERQTSNRALPGGEGLALYLFPYLPRPWSKVPKIAGGVEMVNSLWEVSEQRLLALKKMASPPPPPLPPVGSRDAKGGNEGWISSLDALNALIWRHSSKARRLLSDDQGEAGLWMPANIRRKLSPPLPEDYLGNALGLIYVQAMAPQLNSQQPRAVGALASAIRGAISDFQDPQGGGLFSTLRFLRALMSFDNVNGNDFFTTDHTHMGLHSLDWGATLGRVECVREDFLPRPIASQATFLPRRPDGTLEILMTLESGATERLRSDPEFTSHVAFVGL